MTTETPVTLGEALALQLKSSQEFVGRATRWLTDDDAAFKPQGEGFSALEQLAHIAQTVDWFYDGAFGGNGFNTDWESHQKELKACKSLADARAWIDRSYDRLITKISSSSDGELNRIMVDDLMGGMPVQGIVGGVVDHTAHHRGALSVYARLCGKVAPMPYMDM